MLKKSLRNSFLILIISMVSAIAADDLKINSSWSKPESRPAFISHEDWLGIPLPHEELVRLKQDIEKREGVQLFDNDESHIKVITQSEWRILKQRVIMDDLEKLATKYSMMKMPLTPKCIGKVEILIKGKSYYSWVLNGESKEIKGFRRELWRFFMTKGGQGPEFQWKKWKPAVTIGSTMANFDEEIALKEQPACAIPLAVSP